MRSIQTKIMNVLTQGPSVILVKTISYIYTLRFGSRFGLFVLQTHLFSSSLMRRPLTLQCAHFPHHRGTYRTSTLMSTAFILWTQHAQRMSKPACFTSEIKLNLTAGLTSCCPRCSIQIWPAKSLQVTALSRTPHLCFCYSFAPVALTWLLIVLL